MYVLEAPVYIALLSLSIQSSEMHLHASVVKMQLHLQTTVCEELAQGPYTVTVSDDVRTHRPIRRVMMEYIPKVK